MFKQESTQIGRFTYTVTQLDAVRGRRALVRLTKIVGPAFAAMKGESEEERVTSAFGTLLAGLGEADVDYFCDLFAPLTAVSGGPYKGAPQLSDVFATHFVTDYGAMSKWLFFCLRMNFESFFGEAVRQFGKSQPESASA